MEDCALLSHLTPSIQRPCQLYSRGAETNGRKFYDCQGISHCNSALGVSIYDGFCWRWIQWNTIWDLWYLHALFPVQPECHNDKQQEPLHEHLPLRNSRSEFFGTECRWDGQWQAVTLWSGRISVRISFQFYCRLVTRPSIDIASFPLEHLEIWPHHHSCQWLHRYRGRRIQPGWRKT